MVDSLSTVRENLRLADSKVRPLVSIVIPCFNAERWVRQAIDSVLMQSGSDVEVVVVDDGSTDRSRQVLERYGRSLVVILQKNQGVVAARRAGVAKASGRFIKFLDADDLLPAGALSEVCNAAIHHPQEVLVGRAVAFGKFGNPIEGMYDLGYRPDHLALLKKEYLLTQATHSSLWVIPRELFLKHDIFGAGVVHLGEEFGFCMRLIDSGVRIRYLDVVVSSIRVHESPNRLSKSTDESRHFTQVIQIKRAVRFIQENIPGHSSDAVDQIARMCWSRGRSCLRIGCVQAGSRYFELAREIKPKLLPVGNRMYRALCSIFGPRVSEAALDLCKNVLRVSTRS